MVTPAARAFSISRRIVHCRMTSALRGTRGFYDVPSRRGSDLTAERAGDAENCYLRSQRSLRFMSPRLRLVERNSPEQVEVRQHHARAEHDRRQRIFGELHRQAGLFPEPLAEILNDRAADAQHNAADES